jgi:predicted TIM-barrel fold metal-dependent hydrolase
VGTLDFGLRYHRPVIVDFHTHIFPPSVIEQRERLLQADPTFRLLYADPKAKLATADDLLRSMAVAGVDVSVALGFQWSDEALCRLHNDYLLEAAERSAGRIVPFCILPLAGSPASIDTTIDTCIKAGAQGFGELRPENTGFELDGEAGSNLADLAVRTQAALLFHVTEPVGHAYAGKEGLDVGAFARFATGHPEVTAVGAHWAGGLPFYASMPEVRRLFEGNLYVDTAATSLLYDDAIYERVAALIGPERILFGSDFPLLGQKRSRRRIEESGLDAETKALILGVNAMTLLKLS